MSKIDDAPAPVQTAPAPQPVGADVAESPTTTTKTGRSKGRAKGAAAKPRRAKTPRTGATGASRATASRTSKRAAQDDAATPQGAPTTGRTAPKTKYVPTLVGLEPRADLLPKEVQVERSERAVARRAWLGVALVAVVAVLVSGGAMLEAARSGTELATAQAEGSTILQDQVQYAPVRTVQRQTALLKAAQAVAGSDEIDWDATLTSITNALPQDAAITGMTVSSADPIADFAQSTTPLDSGRIATLSLTVSSSTIPSVPDLTDALEKIPGATNVSITSISGSQGAGGTYTSQVAMDLDAKALDGKYKAKD